MLLVHFLPIHINTNVNTTQDVLNACVYLLLRLVLYLQLPYAYTPVHCQALEVHRSAYIIEKALTINMIRNER